MDPVKVVGVAEWPEPTSKQEVQSFLGFVNFYCRFVKDFAHHAQPLFNLTEVKMGLSRSFRLPEAERVGHFRSCLDYSSR
jgi:hypothetical protein